MEQVDLLDSGVKEVMGDAGPDGFREGIKSLLLLKAFWICSEFQA